MQHRVPFKKYQPFAEKTTCRAYYEKVGQNFYEGSFEARAERICLLQKSVPRLGLCPHLEL
jgi:hypothetical protein